MLCKVIINTLQLVYIPATANRQEKQGNPRSKRILALWKKDVELFLCDIDVSQSSDEVISLSALLLVRLLLPLLRKPKSKQLNMPVPAPALVSSSMFISSFGVGGNMI